MASPPQSSNNTFPIRFRKNLFYSLSPHLSRKSTNQFIFSFLQEAFKNQINFYSHCNSIPWVRSLSGLFWCQVEQVNFLICYFSLLISLVRSASWTEKHSFKDFLKISPFSSSHCFALVRKHSNSPAERSQHTSTVWCIFIFLELFKGNTKKQEINYFFSPYISEWNCLQGNTRNLRPKYFCPSTVQFFMQPRAESS